MTHLGIKNLTLENWTNPDPLMTDSVKPTNNGFSVMTGKDWATSILEPKLEAIVPMEIHKLFEVARGSMLYGYFFYPLFTLAFEQLTRVAEAAVKEKCKQISTSRSIDTFYKRVSYLEKINILSDEEKFQWESVRKLRNMASHPDQQSILPPAVTLEKLFLLSKLISRCLNTFK